jgi:hypothetical protein
VLYLHRISTLPPFPVIFILPLSFQGPWPFLLSLYYPIFPRPKLHTFPLSVRRPPSWRIIQSVPDSIRSFSIPVCLSHTGQAQPSTFILAKPQSQPQSQPIPISSLCHPVCHTGRQKPFQEEPQLHQINLPICHTATSRPKPWQKKPKLYAVSFSICIASSSQTRRFSFSFPYS